MSKSIHWGTVPAHRLGKILGDIAPRRIRYIAVGPVVLCWYAGGVGAQTR